MVTAPASSSLPDDVRRLLDELETNERRAQALVADLDDASLNWRPDDRSWSTAQCLDHLNVADRIYLEAMRPTIEDARREGKARRGPIRPGWFERWFVANLEPPPKRKLSAPKKIIPALRGEKTRCWPSSGASMPRPPHSCVMRPAWISESVFPIPSSRWSDSPCGQASW